MIKNYQEYLGCICAVISIILMICSLYAYRVNKNRAPDDPEKKDISPLAILLAPITLPFLILVNIIILTLSSLAFGVFLLLFPFALLFFHKPFLIKWIQKHAERIGIKLLKINTALLQAAGLYHPPLKPII